MRGGGGGYLRRAAARLGEGGASGGVLLPDSGGGGGLRSGDGDGRRWRGRAGLVRLGFGLVGRAGVFFKNNSAETKKNSRK